jgi:hypothetical protein
MPSNEETSASLGGVSILAVTPLDREARLCAADLRSLLELVAAPSVEGESIGGLSVLGERGFFSCHTTSRRRRRIKRR